MEPLVDRRGFVAGALSSLTTLALLDGLAGRKLFAGDVQQVVDDWIKQVNEISREVQSRKLKDVEFQKSLEELYGKIDLSSLLKAIDFERMAKDVEYPAIGEKSLPVEFKQSKILPKDFVFGRQIFALKKGRSVVPHGHNNMATGFIVLDGQCRGRHYDRIEDNKDHYIIRPTIDKSFKAGEFSTISDHKDNVHWFTAETDHAFIFNVHVLHTDPTNDKNPGRVYIDPMGEKLSGGLVKAPKITYGKANQLYG